MSEAVTESRVLARHHGQWNPRPCCVRFDMLDDFRHRLKLWEQLLDRTPLSGRQPADRHGRTLLFVQQRNDVLDG